MSHLPSWALGFWQSRLRYERDDDVLAVARKYRELGIPVSAIVIEEVRRIDENSAVPFLKDMFGKSLEIK